jgi:hypothetical protein
MNNNRLNTPVNSLVPLNVPGAEMINNLHQNVQKLNNKVNNVLNNTFNNVSNAANNTFNNVANVANNAASVVNNVAKNVGSTTENMVANIVPKNTPVFSVDTAQTGWIISLAIFGILVFIFIVVFMFFQQQITDGMNSFFTSIRDALGMKVSPPPSEEANTDVTKPSTPPDQESNVSASIAEKILPTGAPGSEVFSVSKNTFTYYDAQPLCKALGAELATYDQVKAAWDRGADWCNYGWVKGQNAIFPTQTDTWQKLQGGPEDQRGACGRPGINGGYFDNPELRFGVNCYGPKPAQSTHDESTVAKRTGQPLTVGALEVEKKVNKFRSEADNIGVLPFSDNKWSSS